MNDDFPLVREHAVRPGTRYKAPIQRHFFTDGDDGIPHTVLAGILPIPWVSLIMRLPDNKVNILLQQKYMVNHAETLREKIEQALFAYDIVTVEFMDCETEARLVEELYSVTRPARKSA